MVVPKQIIVSSILFFGIIISFHLFLDIFHSTNLARPQLQFADKIDNSSAPFIPKITHKPNALVPLDPIIIQGQASILTKSNPPNLGSGGFYPHPYEYEIRALQFMESQLQSRPEVSQMWLCLT